VIVSVLFGGVCFLTGATGFALVPDTALYSRRGFHLWPSPLGDLLGTAAGRWGVVIGSAACAGLVVYLLPHPRARLLFVIAGGYWLLHPGVDAAGALAVLQLDRTDHRRWLVPAALVHPVAALASWPRAFIPSPRYALIGCGLCAFACVMVVGLVDTFDTTQRYVLPFVALLCARLPRVLA
jgi:hypothetical protein